MHVVVIAIATMALVATAIWYMVGGRLRRWSGPNFLDPTGRRDERQRRRGAAIIEAAVLLTLYPFLTRTIGLDGQLAIAVLGALCVGLFLMPGLTRVGVGLLTGIIAFITVPWGAIAYGPAALLMITVYLIAASLFAPDR
ncbi:hypothetical protein FJ251_13715 [bacterium]|nr:hypothetical protein [bacterium]